MFPLHLYRQKIYEKIFGFARGEMNSEPRKLFNRKLLDLYEFSYTMLLGHLNSAYFQKMKE
jgi:hypothetical protein